MDHLQRLEEDFRQTVQGLAGKLDHREMFSMKVLADRLHLERLRKDQDHEG